MSTGRPSITDQELWRSLATDGKAASGTVSDNDLAAWLEGRLAPAEAARVDAILAANPEQRAAVLELSEILAMPLPAAPARLAVRAQALVGFEAEREPASRPGLLAFLFAPTLFAAGRRQTLRTAAMATAGAILAVSGFLMGGGLGESYAHQKQITVVSSTDTPSELIYLFSDGNVI
jgi:anti-sigma factor RsiW